MKVKKGYTSLPSRFSRFSKDDLLNAFGLEVRRDATDYLWPALGIFSAGMLLGAGLGLLFAPRRGSELRETIARRVQRKRAETYPVEEKEYSNIQR